jgi:hypothetical protein
VSASTPNATSTALLTAAKSAFATSGVDVPAKQIIELAGVGVGTLCATAPNVRRPRDSVVS